jgi:hypothetical protein
MNKLLYRLVAVMMFVLMVGTQILVPPPADSRDRVQYRAQTHYRRPGIYQRHPIISRTLTGAALGALGGVAVGAIAGKRRIGRGALIGAGVGSAAGFGYGLYRNRQYTGRWF